MKMLIKITNDIYVNTKNILHIKILRQRKIAQAIEKGPELKIQMLDQESISIPLTSNDIDLEAGEIIKKLNA